jgi:hypothetical protein
VLRYAIGLFLLSGLFAGVLPAQSSNGYVFFAPGGVTCCGQTSMTLQTGLGGEAVLFKGIGAGVEISGLAPRECLTDCAVGILSPNGYYHFIHGKGVALDPFVTGGYTLMFRAGHANLFNFGGGVNYWFHKHLGVRLEARDHVRHPANFPAAHYWGFRVGLGIR